MSASLENIATLTGHTNVVTSSVFLENSKLVTGSFDMSLRFWDVNAVDSSIVVMSDCMIGSLTSLNDNLLACGSNVSNGRYLSIWDAAVQRKVATVPGGRRGAGPINCLEPLPDGRFAAGGDRVVNLWDPITVTTVMSMRGHTDSIHCLATLPNGCLVSGSGEKDKSIRVWDPVMGTCLKILRGHERAITSIVSLPDGKIASSSLDGTVRLWDSEAEQCIATFGDGEATLSLAVQAEGSLVCGGTEGSIKLLDTDIHVCLATKTGHRGHVGSMTMSHEGILATAGADTFVRLWSVDCSTVLLK